MSHHWNNKSNEHITYNWINQDIENLTDAERTKLACIFLEKVYASFFVFEKTNKNLTARQFIDQIISSRIIWEFSTSVIESDVLRNSDPEIWDAYIFPFIKVEYNPFDSELSQYTESSIRKILEEFKGTFFRYICVFEIRWKIIVFTDLKEDFLDTSINNLSKIWFKKIEIHTVIPRIINSLAEQFENNDAQIKEMGISFPLSMLWSHANIKERTKNSVRVSSDLNFKNLIRYGLLDSVKINAWFNIAFSITNDKDKYVLPGFLYSKRNWINTKLIESLKSFLFELDKKDAIKNSDFVWLPIYVIVWKRIYEKTSLYPTFSLHRNPIDHELELKVDFHDIWANITEKENNISGKYNITGVFPQYLKEWKINQKEVYCTLSYKWGEDIDWIPNESSLLEIFGDENKLLRADTFLTWLTKKLGLSYYYKLDDYFEEFIDIDEGADGHPNFMPSDLLFTASSDNSGADYLINITVPKKWSDTFKSNEEKKLSVDLYRLSSFNFDIEKIKTIISRYYSRDDSSFKWIYRIGYIQKIQSNDLIKAKLSSSMGWNFSIDSTGENFEISQYCWITRVDEWHTKGKTSNKKVTYTCPDKYKDLELWDNLTMEDLWSLAFHELLKKGEHRAYFWWRTKWGKARELADIISIRKGINKDSSKSEYLDINFFHMKLWPYEQKSSTKLEVGFYEYTNVVGQSLEKLKSFLYAESLEEIIEWLKQYFSPEDSKKYIIFEDLEKSIRDNKDNQININIHFPIKERDYFPDLRYHELNTNQKLALETNWKRLKILSEVFNANISNLNNPKMRLRFNLWLVICKNHHNKDITLGKDDISTVFLVLKNSQMFFR